MTLCFTLTMPNRGSWNGKWSGENNFYGCFRSVSKATADKLDGQDFYYHWKDGWGANISIHIASGNVLRQLRKKSKGFHGYEWMVDSILKHGKIYTDHEIPKEQTV